MDSNQWIREIEKLSDNDLNNLIEALLKEDIIMDSNRWRKEIEKLSDNDLVDLIKAFQKLLTWEIFIKEYGGIGGICNFLTQEHSKRDLL